MNAIFFDSYFTPSVKNGSAFDKFDWPTPDFPGAFSRLIALPGSHIMDIPSTFQFPPNPMFVDIFTFRLEASRLGRKSRFSRRNDITQLAYKLAVTLRPNDEYEIALEGSHQGIKFQNITVKAPDDRTEMIRIRLSASRTLYAALTFLPPGDQAVRELIRPRPISRPAPDYPPQVHAKKWGGHVRILCTISAEGKVAPQDYILLECPHTIFARKSLETVLNRWTFAPATDSGIPVSFRTTLNVPFAYFSTKRAPTIPVPRPLLLPR